MLLALLSMWKLQNFDRRVQNGRSTHLLTCYNPAFLLIEQIGSLLLSCIWIALKSDQIDFVCQTSEQINTNSTDLVLSRTHFLMWNCSVYTLISFRVYFIILDWAANTMLMVTGCNLGRTIASLFHHPVNNQKYMVDWKISLHTNLQLTY